MGFRLKISLLPRIIIAIILGIVFGNVFSLPWVRVFTTFNAVFSQFLGFMIPLIIVGLVTPAIADIGKSAGKLLLITVAIAYLDTVISGILSYGTGSWLFPAMVENTANITKVEEAVTIAPFFRDEEQRFFIGIFRATRQQTGTVMNDITAKELTPPTKSDFITP